MRSCRTTQKVVVPSHRCVLRAGNQPIGVDCFGLCGDGPIAEVEIVKSSKTKPQEAYGMDRRNCRAVFACVLLTCVFFAGCGSGSNNGSSTTPTTPTTPLASTTDGLPGGKVGTPYFVSLGVSGGTPPYTWSQTSGGAMPGGITLSPQGILTGTPTTAGSFGPYVFQVTDANSATASTGSLNIAITASPLSVTTTSLPNGVVNAGYSATLTATGGSAPYTWTVTSGGALPAGLALGTAGGITGTPTASGTYGPYVFTATDTTNATAASGNISITITPTPAVACVPAGNESALASTSPYAFLLKGSDNLSAPIDIAGSFTPNGTGGITAAVADYNGLSNGHQHLQVNLAASSYSFSASGQGCLSLAFSGLQSAVATVVSAEAQPELKSPRAGSGAHPLVSAVVVPGVQFNFALGAALQSGRIVESDTATTGTISSGFIHVQSPAAFASTALAANYAFGVDGWTNSSQFGLLRTSLAGTFALNSTTGALSSGYADLDAGGRLSGELTGLVGNLVLTIDSATGRGTGTYFVLGAPSGPLTFDFVFYVLNGSDLILLSTGNPAANSTSPLLGGRALASSATYAATALNGYYLLASQGLEASSTAMGNLAQIATLNSNGAGGIAATLYTNDAGTFTNTPFPGSTYTIELASGRVSLAAFTTPPPVIYLTGAATPDDQIAGFVVGTDPQASSGVLVNQSATAPAYTNATVAGNWAASTNEDLDDLNGAFLNLFTFNGAGAYTVPTPLVAGSLTNYPKLGTISVNADGSGNVDNGAFPFVTNGQTLYAIPASGDPLLYVFTAGQP